MTPVDTEESPVETTDTGRYGGVRYPVDRREGEAVGINGNGFPWWVRAITVMGVPSAIAVFLVWMGAREVPVLKTKVELTYLAVQQTQAQLEEMKELQSAQLRMMVKICSNTARNEDERQRCFDK